MAEVTYEELDASIDVMDLTVVIKPVALAKELEVAPQIVYGYIRNGGLPAHTKNGTGRYILREEFAAWEASKAEKKAERERKKAEKEAKAAADAEAKAAGGGETESTEGTESAEGDEDYEG